MQPDWNEICGCGKIDPVRILPPADRDLVPADEALNAGKESLVLDLSAPADFHLLEQLVRRADVLIEPFRPGYLDHKGIGYSWACALNPQLIWVSLTGYGQDGPMSQEPGHDINFAAMSGILALNGTGNGDVMPLPIQVADTAGGGYMAVIATLAALCARQKSNIGQQVDVSMVEGLLPLVSLQMAHQSLGDIHPGGHPLAGSLACYNVYPTGDGRHVALGALEPKFWSRFCKAVAQEDWISRQFDSDQALLIDEVTDLIRRHGLDYWVGIGIHHHCCLTAVNRLCDLKSDPHLMARNALHLHNGVMTAAPPIRFSRTPCTTPSPTQEPGADNITIRQEFTST